MPELTKETPTKYRGGNTEYVAIPRSVWFSVKEPSVRSWISGEAKLDHQNKPWEQFKATDDHFVPMGHREPIVFQKSNGLRCRIVGPLSLESKRSIREIGEEGTTPFSAPMQLDIQPVGPEGQPCGNMWFAPCQPNSHDFQDDQLFVTIYVAPDHLSELSRELLSRPNAYLSVRLKVSMFQERIEDMASEHWMSQTFLIERNSNTPIIEFEISVVEGERAIGESDPDTDEQQSESPLPVAVAPDLSPVVTRLNWAIGLLAVLVLILLFR